MKYDIAIYTDRLVTMNPKREVLSDASVGIQGDRIAWVGKGPIEATKTIRKKDSILIPGLINTHTHIPMTTMRGIADDFHLMHWLEKYIFPTEGKFASEEFVYWGSKLAALELISSGSTTICDMFYYLSSIAKACDESGIRAFLAGDCSLAYLQHLSIEERLEKGLEMNEKYNEEFKKYKRVRNILGPHSPYSINEKYLRKISAMAVKYDLPISMHVSETRIEPQLIEKLFGKKIRSPIQYLNDIDFFEAKVLSVHTVWADDQDLDILAQKKVHVAHCPQSNLKLGSGIAPVDRMIEKGIVVSIGTDGPASNNDLILWEDMTLTALLHKGHRLDPTILPAQKVFEMATIDGAKALWMDKEIGSIEVGKKADLVLIDTSSPHQIPNSQNVYSQLVYSTKSSDVATVLIDGNILYEDREFTTLKKDEIYAQTKSIRHNIDEFLKSRS